MIEHIILAFLVFMASAGSVVLIHASPLPVPNIKPFNCAFCTIVWTAWVFWSFIGVDKASSSITTLLLALSFPVPAALLVGLAPWMFRSFESSVLQSSSDATTRKFTTRPTHLTEFIPTDDEDLSKKL